MNMLRNTNSSTQEEYQLIKTSTGLEENSGKPSMDQRRENIRQEGSHQTAGKYKEASDLFQLWEGRTLCQRVGTEEVHRALA